MQVILRLATDKICLFFLSSVNALDASQETPELQGIPGGLKVLLLSRQWICTKKLFGSHQMLIIASLYFHLSSVSGYRSRW